MHTKPITKPVGRSRMRIKAATAFHTGKRYLYWLIVSKQLTKRISNETLPCLFFEHETVLLRQLKDVDMHLQYNKIMNLRLAAEKLNGVVLHPGETFSYWRLIGKPTYRKGYLDGVTLSHGKVMPGCGGGLCQLSNLIYWMTLHTPLTVTERHRHGYDVFPDASRSQPFGSGATCFYPYGDLMIRNTTEQRFQLCVRVGPVNLEGAWRSDKPPAYTYKVVERNHFFNSEYWGGYSRHNELYRQISDKSGKLISEEIITENHALTMYSPLIKLPQNEAQSPSSHISQ